MISNFMRDRWKFRLASRLKIVEMAQEVGDTVLDCGFGSGPFFELFKLSNIEYTGIDITHKFVKSCRERFSCDKHRFLQGDILNIPFKEKVFSTVFCSSVLEHLPPEGYRTAIKEMIRVSSKQIILDFFRPLLDTEIQYHWSKMEVWDNQYNREEITRCIPGDVRSCLIKMGKGFTDHEIVRAMNDG